ncbi:MAG: hypothetical protein IT337_18165 [Thermomicrobiales bacterium]|nr:hypothetical protein [Thermomicrobiales bacterium]
MTPQPKPEKPTLPVRERLRVEPRWATLTIALEDLSEEEPPETVLPAPELLPEAPVAAVVAEPAPVVVAEPPTVVVEEPPAVVVEEPPAVVVEEPTAVVVEEPAAVIVEEPIAVVAVEPAAVVAVEPEIVPEPEPEPVKSVAPPARTITIPVVATTDVTGVDDLDLATAIRERLTADTRVANFGEQWMMEDRVPRFSRGDLRRMKDYLQEQERPLPDDVLAQDVLNVRPGSPEFDLVRFAINYRLSHEHRDFEFVGSTNQRYWSTSSLSPIGTGRRKPNELGSDYRFLLEETPESIAHRSIESVDHVLTFFEYLHGLLPYDAELQKLTPGPMLHGQRAAVLTFECPQSYTTYLVELRYPTPNRGGFILGLDDFYGDNLVPGAVISISATENDGHYRVEFLAENPRNARLLELDERRSAQRYVFRPTTYSCGVDEGMLLTEERFGGLNGEKPLDDKVRRRPESVVAATFERVGDRRESNYSANFDTLLAAVNVERPMSATLLRSVLENDDTGAFSHDPEGQDDYTYVPGATP